MTRKGKLPIAIPSGVEVKFENSQVMVKGPKGNLTQGIVEGINVEVADNQAVVSVSGNYDDLKKFQGLYRTLIENMVIGLTKGFEKRLEMIGVGYRAVVQGKAVNLSVGKSHPTNIEIPEHMEVKVEKNTTIIISGIDKQKVGQFAAELRSVRKPEPYQGKGIRYVGEYVRRKAGKTAGKK